MTERSCFGIQEERKEFNENITGNIHSEPMTYQELYNYLVEIDAVRAWEYDGTVDDLTESIWFREN